MVELCDQQKGVIKPVTSQLSLASQLESVASGNGHPGVAVTDAGRHVCTPEIRMPSTRAFSRVPVDPFVWRLADATPGCPDASQRQPHPRLGAEQEPFTVDIGPVALSRSAALARVWPHDAPLDPPLQMNLRVRAGLANAGLVLPEATETYFPHMSAAYGMVDTHCLNEMNRADALASALLRHARHHVTGRVKSVWLVREPNIPTATPTPSNGSRSCPWGAEQQSASASRHPSQNHHAIGADAGGEGA
ncbi:MULTISPECIES: hypothetical protein [Streptomyces]|uniref:hypothetical protein n=1 Tax=Streptomyces TaxID=1883 RepID=UPI0029B6106F|nr:hypothetical protein [Streptomyces europaeiscabiei]MDX3715781.1 hypothetical protein [Streptomyces europaeiscabiei]WSG19980.1 hypothetical protein OHB30_02210 [Streptomyces europaeiscabiei]